MADLAVVLKNRQHVSVERRLRIRLLRHGRALGWTPRQQKCPESSDNGGDLKRAPPVAARRQFFTASALLIMFRQVFFFNRVAAQQLREVLRKGGTRQHHVAAGLRCLHLQLTLYM